MKNALVVFLALASACIADPVTAKARRGRCHETVQAQGELRAASTVSIHAPEMEEHYLTVKSVLDNGTAVRKGDVVMEFDDNLYQLALKAAQQEVALKQAQRELTRFQLDDELIRADLEIKRREIAVAKAETEIVRDQTITSPVEQKKAQLSVQLAQLEVSQAKALRAELDKKKLISLKVKDLEVAEAQRKVDDAKRSLEKIVVRAPRDGVIYKPFVRLNNEKGRVERNKVVRPGDKLLELPSSGGFEGQCYLPGADVRWIKPGDAAAVALTVHPQTPFAAKVVRKDPYPMTRNERLGRDDAEGHLKEFEVVIALDGSDPAFRAGLTFTASIDVTLAEDAVYVPRAAVHTDADRSTWVQVEANGRTARVPVTMGAAGYAWAVIEKGLSEGQSVVIGD